MGSPIRTMRRAMRRKRGLPAKPRQYKRRRDTRPGTPRPPGFQRRERNWWRDKITAVLDSKPDPQQGRQGRQPDA